MKVKLVYTNGSAKILNVKTINLRNDVTGGKVVIESTDGKYTTYDHVSHFVLHGEDLKPPSPLDRIFTEIQKIGALLEARLPAPPSPPSPPKDTFSPLDLLRMMKANFPFDPSDPNYISKQLLMETERQKMEIERHKVEQEMLQKQLEVLQNHYDARYRDPLSTADELKGICKEIDDLTTKIKGGKK